MNGKFVMPIAALLTLTAFVVAGTHVKTTPVKSAPEPFSKEWIKERGDQAQTLKVDHCYVTVWTRQPVFSFEKTYTHVSNIMYVLESDKDGKGILVAQPNPECKFFVEESYQCEYWFRSMSFADPFLVDPDTRETECPAEFTRENMVKRLKASREAGEFKVGQ